MPAPYNAPERVQWRENNADLVEWMSIPANINGNFMRSMVDSLDRYGSLTPAQTEASRRIMVEALRNAPDNMSAAATAEQAAFIYNGTYTINDGAEHLTFKIHTVRNGRLAGKRVIKRQMQYGEFAGFAFLTAEGGVQVWRRYYADEAANERYIVWAKLLLAELRHPEADQDHLTSFIVDGTTYEIQASRTCRACNRALTTPTSIERGIGPECEGRLGADRTNAANAHEQININTLSQSVTVSAESDVALTIQPAPEGVRLRFIGDPPTVEAVHLANGDTVEVASGAYARQNITWPSLVEAEHADDEPNEEVEVPVVDRDADLEQAQIIRLLPTVVNDQERFLRLYRRLDYWGRDRVCRYCGNEYSGARGVRVHQRRCVRLMAQRNESRLAMAEARRVQAAQREAAALAAGPARSQLGTVIGGEVWEQ